ncbi:MAG: hypothetical protein ACT4P5_00985 [Armatimonadota bacterium]
MAQRRNWVGIQIGLVSVVDEGAAPVLDFLQEKAHVNALLPSTLSWSRGNAGRGLDWYPDHGKAEPDHLQGGAMTRIHPQYYAASTIKEFAAPDPLYQGVDFLELILPETRKRGIKVYPYYCETAGAEIKPLWVHNFIHLLEIDAWGRKAARPCLVNPDYRAWVLSYYEDLIRSYPVDGICWGIERRSPLWNMAEGDAPTCFCPHCRRLAHERGIDAERAREGYLAFDDYFRRARARQLDDGHFVEFFRVLQEHPEVLKWEKLWVDNHKSLYREIYGTVKWLDPQKEVGIHIWQLINTFHPFLRAQYDLRDLAHCADWVKPVLYNDVAGYRFNRIVTSYTKTFLGDLEPAEATPFLYKILQLDEAPWADLPKAGFSPAYVRKETRRTVERTGKPVYPGLGIGVQGVGNDSKAITPESVRAAVRAAYEGGASGVCISRNYSEASLATLAAVGDALKELGIGETIPDGIAQVVPAAARRESDTGGSDRVF